MKKFYFFTVLFLMVCSSLQAQWDGNPATVDNPVCTAPTAEQYAFSITDGAGGIIAVWTAFDDNDVNAYVYVQRKTASGMLAWGDTANPVTVFSIAAASLYDDIYLMDIQPDGKGGAYISWRIALSSTSTQIYLQHINSSGNAVFTAPGITCNLPNGRNCSHAKLCTGRNGLYISWTETLRTTGNTPPAFQQVLIQRFDTAGTAQWAPGGIQVSAAAGLRSVPQVVPDTAGGVFIAFRDTRNSSFDVSGNPLNIDIYAQHFSSSGTSLWAQDTIVTAAAYNQQIRPDVESRVFSSMVTDSAGGFILVFEDYRGNNSGPAKLYAQRMNASGVRLWGTEGVQLYSSAALYPVLTQVMTDGANGVVASWDVNNYIGAQGSMYAQRITAAGNAVWGANATEVTPGGSYGYGTSMMAADGSGAYVAAWLSSATNYPVKGQKLNGAGQPQWSAGGVDICARAGASPYKPVLTKSTGNTMIAMWEDKRNYSSSSTDIYAAKIDAGGSLVNIAIYRSIANGNWNDPATWLGNAVPPAGADVLIQTSVIANVDATCNTLTVQAPGSLTVNTGIHITVLH